MYIKFCIVIVSKMMEFKCQCKGCISIGMGVKLFTLQALHKTMVLSLIGQFITVGNVMNN